MEHHVYGEVPEHLDGQVNSSIRHQQKPRIAASKSCHAPPITSYSCWYRVALLLISRLTSDGRTNPRVREQLLCTKKCILTSIRVVFPYERILRDILLFGHWTDVSVAKSYFLTLFLSIDGDLPLAISADNGEEKW